MADQSGRQHRVRVTGLPHWLDATRLLGAGDWVFSEEAPGRRAASCELTTAAAADLAARLRGLGLGGGPVVCEVRPPLKRAAVRGARSDEARRMRETTPGFDRPGGRAQGEGRYSLTPEYLAQEVGRWAEGRPVVDACAGAGGSAIGFAREGCSVVAIEREPARVAELRHNAALYGVAGAIEVVEGDAVDALPGVQGEILFADPPWGGDFDRLRTSLEDLPLLSDLRPHGARFAEVWLKLPPSFDVGCWGDAARVDAVWGEAEGDRRRVKFLIVRLDGQRFAS